MKSNVWSRREVAKSLAALGLGVVAVPMVSSRVRSANEEHPMILSWEGYEEEGFHGDYIAKYGAAPRANLFGDEEEALAKIRAGFSPDLATICSYKVPQWKEVGVIDPIDTSRLSNWPDVIPGLKDVGGTVIDGERYWIPLDWGRTSIIYRTDLVDIEEESWSLLWDERYRRKMLSIDSVVDGVMISAIMSGAKDPFDMTKDEIARTRKLMEEMHPNLLYYTNSNTDIENTLASGEVVAAVGWDSSYVRLKEMGLPVAFMNPKEGAMTWVCGVVLMNTGDPSLKDRSYEVLDSLISVNSGVYEITEWGVAHANSKAYEAVDAETLASLGMSPNPDDLLKGSIFQVEVKNEAELQTILTEVQAGI